MASAGRITLNTYIHSNEHQAVALPHDWPRQLTVARIVSSKKAVLIMHPLSSSYQPLSPYKIHLYYSLSPWKCPESCENTFYACGSRRSLVRHAQHTWNNCLKNNLKNKKIITVTNFKYIVHIRHLHTLRLACRRFVSIHRYLTFGFMSGSNRLLPRKVRLPKLV
jgi:hypothetical protein